MTAAALLELTTIRKRFANIVALDDASIVVQPGSIHALLGENGAGKTTLMRVAYGMLRPDAGELCVRGHAGVFDSPSDAVRAGIGMVHQHFTLVPSMTVAENLALGGRGLLHAKEMISTVREVAERTGFPLDPDARVESLSVGAQQRVEIAKAIVRNPDILILDEPTAVLSVAEARRFLALAQDVCPVGTCGCTHHPQTRRSARDFRSHYGNASWTRRPFCRYAYGASGRSDESDAR